MTRISPLKKLTGGKLMSPFRRHVLRWENCQKCLLCHCRQKVVIARGKIPAPILFIGEAPGDSEDTLGIPFCGPAGRLLDHFIREGFDGQHDYAMSNLVCCIPKDVANSKGEPPKEAIMACAPRLQEFIGLVKPKLIVTVGRLSDLWGPKIAVGYRGKWASILHPAAVLRMDASQQSLAIKRCIVTLSDAATGL